MSAKRTLTCSFEVKYTLGIFFLALQNSWDNAQTLLLCFVFLDWPILISPHPEYFMFPEGVGLWECRFWPSIYNVAWSHIFREQKSTLGFSCVTNFLRGCLPWSQISSKKEPTSTNSWATFSSLALLWVPFCDLSSWSSNSLQLLIGLYFQRPV